MSLLSSLVRGLAADTRAAVTAPIRSLRSLRATVYDFRTGELSIREVLAQVGATLGALTLVGVLLFPVIWIFTASISGQGTVLSSGGLGLIPSKVTFDPYLWVLGGFEIPSYTITFQAVGYEISLFTPGAEMPIDCSRFGGCSEFPRFFWNSMTVVIPTVLIAMSVIVPAAYALSRREFIAREKVLYGYVLFTQIGGGLGIATLIALFAMFAQFGLTNNKLVLAIYYAATAVPFNTWLLKTYLDGIPTSYEEAAIVDGASSWRVVWEVILPLAKPGLATVFVFTFLAGWMEFVVAQTMLDMQKATLPVGLFGMIGEYTIPWPRFSAFALSFAAPVIVVYFAAQRYMEGSLSFSGMEG